MGPEQEAWFDSPAEGTRSACSGHHGAICAAGRARGAPPHAVQRGPGALLAKGTVILQPGQAGLRRGFVAAVLGDEWGKWGRVVRSFWAQVAFHAPMRNQPSSSSAPGTSLPGRSAPPPRPAPPPPRRQPFPGPGRGTGPPPRADPASSAALPV